MSRAVDPSTAVILSGGGAYGAYEVGVLKALFTGESASTNHDYLNPGIFTGTSVGAFNAAFIVSREEDICATGHLLETLWLEQVSENPRMCGNGVFRFRGDPFRLLDPDCVAQPAMRFDELLDDGAYLARDTFRRVVNLVVDSGSAAARTLGLFDIASFITGAPLTSLVKQAISMEHIRRSNKVLRLVATNWSTGHVKVFENSDMSDEEGFEILRGSAAIPGFFHAHLVDGQLYVDGGLLMNTPLKCAILAGATTLHVIYMDPDPKNIPIMELQNTIGVMDRTMAINAAARVDQDIETAAWINEGLEVIERAGRNQALSGADAAAFIRVAGQLYDKIKAGSPYRKVTIHRYHPHDDLGGGTLALLNFDRSRIESLIKRGFEDALKHDCAASHCVIPN
jgi:predicted acylesterase/phospholipase RssA